MLKRSLVFTTPFQLSLRNGQIVINTEVRRLRFDELWFDDDLR